MSGSVIDGKTGDLVVTDVHDAKAQSVFTSTGALGNNETVTIGATVYTYKTALTPAAYEVLIGADQTASHLNLLRAINAGAGSGTLYGAGTVAHPSVEAIASDGTTTTIRALVAGTAANSIATTETCANASWPGATMNSGTPGTDAQTVAVRALTYCRSIKVQEHPPDSPTTAFEIYKPDATDTPLVKNIGASYTFEARQQNGSSGFYAPRQIAGYILLVAGGGTKTFSRDEVA